MNEEKGAIEKETGHIRTSRKIERDREKYQEHSKTKDES